MALCASDSLILVFKISASWTEKVSAVLASVTSVSLCGTGTSLTNTCSCSSVSFVILSISSSWSNEAFDSMSSPCIVGDSITLGLSCTSSMFWIMSSSFSLSTVTSRELCSAASEFLVASTDSAYSS